MSEKESFFRPKKRKLDSESTESNDFLSRENEFESQRSENLDFQDNQQTPSQQLETEIFDLTLVPPPEAENAEPTKIWQKIQLDAVDKMLRRKDRNLFDVPEAFFAQIDGEGKYLGVLKCSDKKCETFQSRDKQITRRMNYKISHSKFLFRNHFYQTI